METDEKAEQGLEKIKAEEGIQGMLEVKVEPSQVLTVTVDPSMVKSEPLDPLDPTSSGMIVDGEDMSLLNTSNEILAQYYQRILAHCRPCETTFPSSEQCVQHCSDNKTYKCSETQVKDAESYKCSVEFSCEIGDCDWMGPELDHTKIHIKQHLVDTGYLVRCDSCGEPQLSELQGKHILFCVKNRQATNEIDEIIRDLLNEENHDKYHKWKKVPPVDTYLKKLLSVCHKCGISFEGYKGVLNHWNNDHREEQPKFQCKFSICEYVANKGDQLKTHIDNHLLNAGRHCKCPFCGKVFNKAKLTPHIKQVHTKVEKAVECPKCGKKFKEARHVRKHMKDVHSKDELKCGECLKSFSKLRYLNIHIRNEHHKNHGKELSDESQEQLGGTNSIQNEPLNLSISLASNPGEGISFVEIKEEPMNIVKEEEPDGEKMDDISEPKVESFDALEPHSLEKRDDIKTNGGQCQDHGPDKFEPGADNTTQRDKPGAEEALVYVCQECGKAYGRQDVLRNHVRAKHGCSGTEDSLILKCSACEKTYGRRDCLRKHFRRKHINFAKKYVTFDCNQCDKTFSSRDKLTRHKIQHTASDGKPFRCEKCSERFTRKDAMVRHMKRQHSC